jgi:hypothetical protein
MSRVPAITERGVRVPGPVPECPPGSATAPPDFVGVGAQRSGTTRWFDLMLEHPRLVGSPATRKELHYFDRFEAGGFTDADRETYARYFPRPPGRLAGEWTPTYMADIRTIALLARAAPEAKLLVLLRDPVERYRSGMHRQHRVAQALGGAIDQNAPLVEYARGLYAEQLSRLLDHVPRSRVLLLQYEACVAEPARELARTFAFLGVEPADVGDPLEQHHPNRQAAKLALDDAVGRALVGAYAHDLRRLQAEWPELDLALWPSAPGAPRSARA